MSDGNGLLEGKCIVISCSPAHRDTIYAGIVEEITERWVVLKHATNIVRLQGGIGVSGHAAGPHAESVLKPSPGDEITLLYTSNTNVIHVADMKAWAPHLPGFVLPKE